MVNLSKMATNANECIYEVLSAYMDFAKIVSVISKDKEVKDFANKAIDRWMPVLSLVKSAGVKGD